MLLRKPVLRGVYIITARRNARIASAVLATTAIPSVCPSVPVTLRYCVKTTACGTVQFALSDSKMYLVKTTNIPQGRPISPEILARTDPYPLLIAASLDTFCLVAPQP